MSNINKDIETLVESRLTPKQLAKYNSMSGYFADRVRKISKAAWVAEAIAEVERRQDTRIDDQFRQRELYSNCLRDSLDRAGLSHWKLFECIAYRSAPASNGAMVDPGECTQVSIAYHYSDNTVRLEATDGWKTVILGSYHIDEIDIVAGRCLGQQISDLYRPERDFAASV